MSYFTTLFGILFFSLFASSTSQHKSVRASFETAPVSSSGDAADDTAFWIHPTNPRASLIVATDKKAGLLLYDLTGKVVSQSPVGLINNIDAQESTFYGNKQITLLAGSDRGENSIALFTVQDLKSPHLVKLGSVPLNYVPYGICMTENSFSETSIFITTKEGLVDHWSIRFEDTDLKSRHIGSWKLSSKAEGCVADSKTGQLFVSEEAVGLWRFSLHNAAEKPVLMDTVQPGRLIADVEGVVIYQGTRNSYVVVSSQGDNSFHLYDLNTLRWQGSFQIVSGNGIDEVSDTDGIEILGANRIDLFPQGLFIAQDGSNTKGSKILNQNFKAVNWGDINF